MVVAIAKGPHSLHHSLKVIVGEDVFKVELYLCLDTQIYLKQIFVYTFYWTKHGVSNRKGLKPTTEREFAIILCAATIYNLFPEAI